MNLGEWLKMAQASLEHEGIENARLEAQVIAAHALRVDRTWIITHPEHDFSELAGESLLHRRLAHEPLAYITGSREFYGRTFAVRKGVLIPRQETETLIDAALEIGAPNSRVLDIGTGSGCIAVTLKLERPKWTLLAGDISWDALKIAHENALQLSGDVQFINADGCRAFADDAFDLIVTNPPYVDIHDPLSPEIKDFEPTVALYGTEGGIGFYRSLSNEAGRLLKIGGVMIMELGAGQIDPLIDLFTASGWK